MIGTDHRLTGADRGTRNIDDPHFGRMVEQLIEQKALDFVFEEATGLGPTTASRIALDRLGPEHYLDVDPPRNRRHEFGIPADTGKHYAIGSPPDIEYATWEFLDVQALREKLWLQQVMNQEFEKALMICGSLHMSSFASRLQSNGFEVEAISYLPAGKL